MGIFSGLFRSRDKPKDSYDSPSYSYFFGRTHAGKRVNDRTAMQIIAVYACVRVLSEAIAQLPLHVYQYTDNGKERVPKHPLYFLLHDQPNPEMTSFVFRETLMAHLLIYGNAYAQIITTDFATAILGEQLDAKGVPVERNDAETSQFALMFEFDGDKNHIRHVLYCCSGSRPATEGETTEESKSVKTEKLSLKASALPNGLVKSKTCESTDETTNNNWYNAVYMPTAATNNSTGTRSASTKSGGSTAAANE